MAKAEIIIQYCKRAGKPITARQIIDACFPGKPQPYINSTINDLVQLRSLIRNDDVRPYTVRLPLEGESVPEPRDYSKGSQTIRLKALGNDTKPIAKFTVEELQQTAQRVKADPRYGEEAAIISSCFRKLPENNDGDIIAMKIALIDMTNSTNLNKHLSKIYLTKLIEKIKTCDFDKRVAMGDTSLIAELAKNEINLFSFFSKYCLYHNYYVYQNDDFAIFDSVMKKYVGGFVSHYNYKGQAYTGTKLHNCIEKMRNTYDYEGYLSLIDAILERNNIVIKGKRRMFDWFVWYNNR